MRELKTLPSAVIFFGILSLFLWSCGSGDYTVNPGAGIPSSGSTAGGTTSGGTTSSGGCGSLTAQQCFEQNIWPIMATNNQNTGGCATSGCHLKSNSLQTTFFQVDTASASTSWNWAEARRASVITGTYAGGSSATLAAQMNANHRAFQNWSTGQRAIITSWTAIP